MKASYAVLFVVLFAGQAAAQQLEDASNPHSSLHACYLQYALKKAPQYRAYVHCLEQIEATRNSVQSPYRDQFIAARRALAERAEASHMTYLQFRAEGVALFA
jgi:hypothetical protein